MNEIYSFKDELRSTLIVAPLVGVRGDDVGVVVTSQIIRFKFLRLLLRLVRRTS